MPLLPELLMLEACVDDGSTGGARVGPVLVDGVVAPSSAFIVDVEVERAFLSLFESPRFCPRWVFCNLRHECQQMPHGPSASRAT